MEQCKDLDDYEDLPGVVAEWDQKLKAKRRFILLLQDNFSGHIPPSEGLMNIHVENFAPNLTAHLHPMDQGIIKCFKAHYQAGYIQCSIDKYEGGITPSNIYDINQLDAMQLADNAWLEVNTTTIRHCWDKAGILADMRHTMSPTQPALPISSLLHPQEDPISIAEKLLCPDRDTLLDVSTRYLWVQCISGSMVQWFR